MRDNWLMRNGRLAILVVAAMAAVLSVAACGGESAPLAVPTATPGPPPTAVPATESAPTPVPTVAPIATPTSEAVRIDEGPELPILPVISTREHKLVGTQEWINSEPLTLAGLAEEGKVVLIDFWTYT